MKIIIIIIKLLPKHKIKTRKQWQFDWLIIDSVSVIKQSIKIDLIGFGRMSKSVK